MSATKKISCLTGSELDYWSAKRDPICAGLIFERRDTYYVGINPGNSDVCCIIPDNTDYFSLQKIKRQHLHGDGLDSYTPSRNWAQAGRLIEQNSISLEKRTHITGGDFWIAYFTSPQGVTTSHSGESPLIAVTRTFVSSGFGDVINLDTL